MSQPGQRLAGYDLVALAGKGGMAEVWRAVAREGPRAGQVVALKRLLPALAGDPAYVELFQREAAITRRLHHPAVVEVLDAGVADGAPYLVMAYVDGKNLREVLAQALDHAHAGQDRQGVPLGIVHCDVSPSNVFISRLGEVKLGDFGVALTPGAALGGAGALGKVHYLAPEQLRGGTVTPRTDLFALGAVLFELLTNQKAFAGGSVDEVGQKILRGELRAPSELRPEIPFALDALTLRCLAAEPEERWPSAAAFAEEIAAHYDPAIGTPLAIAAVVRGLFGAAAP